VRSLPDCVDTTTFKPAAQYDPAELAAVRQKLGIPPDRKLIVYLGLLAEYQGTGHLLEALTRILARHPDVHLLLMGFPNEIHYQQRASALGISAHVTFTGRLPYEQAPTHLALGDVAAAPKMSLTESSGKLLNYMAVGLPTVAFDTPVAREYLGLDGIFATLGDNESLARCLEDVLFPAAGPASLSLYGHLGQRLRQRAMQHFDWEAAGCQILQMYQELTGDLQENIGKTPVELQRFPSTRIRP
jgi:glycosyltransferase involved in cell wall biosynthesis